MLHLEECPAEPDLQEALWAGVQRTLASVRSRYGSLMGNVITVVTSNHSPASVLNPNPTAPIVLHLRFLRSPSASLGTVCGECAVSCGCQQRRSVHLSAGITVQAAPCASVRGVAAWLLRRVRCALSFDRDERSRQRATPKLTA